MLKPTLIKAAEAGAAVIQEYFEGSFEISNKEGVNNLVTEADHASEKAIFDVIKSDYPDHFLLSEEAGEIIMDSNYQWIIDPIDGTVNFAHGIPLCCVSIGLLHKGSVTMGAVYNPMMNELFFAEKGKGATLNGKPIKVSAKSDFKTAFLVTGFPYKWPENTLEHPIKVFER